jgi:2-polyprenyl-3-methyl-5-hydroxy-6-metoxy-1,4-benzoquinol methylase
MIRHVRSFLQKVLYRLPGLAHIPTLIRRADYQEGRTLGLEARIEGLNGTVRFLSAENNRLNELLRGLMHNNELIRDASGDITKGSFEYQWHDLPEGANMPSNPAFREQAVTLLTQFSALPREWFPGKRVLDAGCGIGRWSRALCELGATVTSIDQSPSALAATKALCETFPGHRVERRDVTQSLDDMPTYDLVWCFGVCHHTADMLAALDNVLARVAPGGRLFLMLYGYPQTEGHYAAQALYAEWRQKLAPLPFAERAAAIKAAFPAEDLHGYFDALSPPINELVTWEWMQTYLQDRGFVDVRRSIEREHHYAIAQRR